MNIRLTNVKKNYRSKVVLNIERFHVDVGKIYGIIGPNGAGKSTMLKLIADLEAPSSGSIQYNGKPLEKNIYRRMTYLNQHPYLFKTSVFNNIAYPLKIRNYNKRDVKEKVNNILEEFQIQALSDALATNLSGGESQKVALARALVFQPELLLLDEPTANIDPNSIEVIERAILKRHESYNTTIILVTHNIGQAVRMCEEIIFMNDGKVLECGKGKSLIDKPQRSETKRFLSLEYNIS